MVNRYRCGVVLLTCLFFISLSSTSQQKSTTPVMNTPPAQSLQGGSRSQNTLLNEDFQDVSTPALPTGWTSNSIEGDFETGNAQDANAGGYFPVPDKPGNVFAMANDDVCNCDMSDIELISPTMDFSGKTNMVLRFNAYHDQNWGGGDAKVQVSTDGGTTWNPIKTLNASFSWQFYLLDLGAYDGESSVTLKFEWSDNGTWASGFAVDNIVVDELLDNDLRVNKVFTTDMRQDLEYTRIPISQVHAMDIGGWVQNNGRAVQPNVIMDVSIEENGSTVYTGSSSSIASLDSLQKDTQWVSTNFTPDSLTTYKVNTTVRSDSTEEYLPDNSLSDSVRVTCDEFARDQGDYAGKGIELGPDTNGDYQAFQAGNLFEVFNTGTWVNEVKVAVDSSTDPGAELQGRIYEWIDSTQGFQQVGVTVNHQVTSGEISSPGNEQWIHLPLTNSLPLDSGKIYFVASGKKNTNGARLRVATSGYGPRRTSWVYDPSDSSKFFTSKTPMVRMISHDDRELLSDVTELCHESSVTLDAGSGYSSYSWSNGATSSSITVDSVGMYSVTVTNNRGCTRTDSTQVSLLDSIAMGFTIDSVDCFAGDSGSVTVNPSGGVAPYSYSWGTGDSTPTASGLDAGFYQVIVTDSLGCEDTGMAEVGEPGPITITTGELTPSSCGAADGMVWIAATGGVGDFTYFWPSQGVMDDTLSNITAGSYTGVASDSNGCTADTVVSLDDPGAPAIAVEQLDSVSCYGNSDGMIEIDVSGGTGSYSYSWSPSVSNDTVATGLTGGAYSVDVTDSLGCVGSSSIVVWEPDSMEIGFDTWDVQCYGDSSGIVVAQVSGGTSPYSYSWSNGMAGDSIYDLGPGGYEVFVSDGNGCTASDSTSLAQPADLNPQPTIRDVSCHGGADGYINLEPTGGVSPYEYNWNHGATGDSISGLSEGNYPVAIVDDNGCVFPYSFQVQEPAPIQLSGTVTDNTEYGSIDLSVSGGVSPYSYSWSPGGMTTQDIDSLTISGSYQVVVIDSNGCAEDTTFQVMNVAIEEQGKERAWKIFPNPTKGSFYLSSSAHGVKVQVKVSDIQGRTLKEMEIGSLPAAPVRFDLNGLDGGIYLITVRAKGKGVATYRLQVMN